MNLFITNREIINTGGVESIREDGKENSGDNLRFGKYRNEVFDLFPEPEFETDTNYQDILEKNIEDLKGSARFFRELYDELIKPDDNSIGVAKNDALFFIHGFDTNLTGVRETFGYLEERYVKNPNSPIKHIIIFTWPGMSPGVPYHYFDDREDAIRSGKAFARGIEKVIRFFKEFLVKGNNEPCNRRLHFMAHSMGHRVTKHMMLELRAKNISYPDLFAEIFLMAADIKYDVFEKEEAFGSLIDFGNRIHIYYHQHDRVLDISKYSKNFSNRLGRYGRKRVDPTLADVYDVNVSNTTDDPGSNFKIDKLNHWYYHTSTEVVNDIIKVMNGGSSDFVQKG